MKTVDQLQTMTTREIAQDAQRIIAISDYNTAKALLQNHIKVANQKLKEFGAKTNKMLGTHRSAPQIKVITDFKRFK